MQERFAGRVAIVTGAGSGFGRATALGLARDGAAAVTLVEPDAARLDAAAAEVEALGARPIPLAIGLGGSDGAAHAVSATLEAAGQLDILVSNHAAMCHAIPFLEGSDADWQRQMDVNLTSHYVLARHAAQAMHDAGRGGSIAFTSSVNALGAGRGVAAYCATKAGLIALMQVMAIELAAEGIRVNCVSPGPADTQRSVDLVGEETMKSFRASFPAVPMRRLASAEDIAEAFLYLASDAAAYVTGHNLIVDGGLTAAVYEVPEEDA